MSQYCSVDKEDIFIDTGCRLVLKDLFPLFFNLLSFCTVVILGSHRCSTVV